MGIIFDPQFLHGLGSKYNIMLPFILVNLVDMQVGQ